MRMLTYIADRAKVPQEKGKPQSMLCELQALNADVECACAGIEAPQSSRSVVFSLLASKRATYRDVQMEIVDYST